MKDPEELLKLQTDSHDKDKHWASDTKEGQMCYACAYQAMKSAQLEGLEEGLRMYAHWKDGVEYVGTCGKTLAQALEDVREKYK